MSTPIDINDTTPRVDYTATASQTAFAVPFEFFANTDLVVLVNSAVQALDTDYTVTGAEVENGGTVTFTTGLTAGDEVAIYTDTPYAREVRYTHSGNLPHDVLERDFAKIVRMLQQQKRSVERSIRLRDTDTTVDMNLPLASARANKYLTFGASGEPVVADSVPATTTLNRSSIGTNLWPRTDAETAAGVTPTYYYYEEGDIRRYGAADGGDAGTNTTAIQAAINVASHGGATPRIPVGRFQHSGSLYYHYDASNNAGFNADAASNANTNGNIWLVGERHTDYSHEINNPSPGVLGSILEYTGTGVAHYAGNSTNGSHRNIQFHNLTIIADTANFIFYFAGTSRNSGIVRSWVIQKGVGGGIDCDDCFGMWFQNMRCHTSNVANTGIGLRGRNPNNSAGNFNIIDSSVKDFDEQIVIGHRSGGSTAYDSLDTVAIVRTQAAGGTKGISIGEQVDSLRLDNVYLENSSVHALELSELINAFTWTGGYVRGNSIASAVPVVDIGEGGGNWLARQGAINIIGVSFKDMAFADSYIRIARGNNSGAVSIRGCIAAPDTAAQFLEIVGDGTGVELAGNNLAPGGTTFPLSGGIPLEWTTTGADIDHYRSGNPSSAGAYPREKRFGVWQREVLSDTTSSTADLDMSYAFHKYNSTAGTITRHVQDGLYDGQEITFTCNTYVSNVNIDFATDTTKDTTLGTTGMRMNSVDDYLKAMWDGGKWRLVANNGCVTY